MASTSLQRRRRLIQAGFFLLFVLAPPLDILRIDLTRGHAILFGMDWTLGIDAFISGQGSPLEAAFNLFWRGFLPLFGGGALFLWIAWRFGRLYCGWLCPHFSVVETINRLMLRASGKPSVWERRPLPERQVDGSRIVPNAWYWIPTLLAVFGFAFLWAVVLLTYLLPPVEIYGNLVRGELTLRQSLFIGVATTALVIEFLLARHLFCRFGCAVGLFQSLAWMANDRAMVVGFDTTRARACQSCNNACDNACPMRLNPRSIKRRMFTCTECAQCIAACTQVQGGDTERSLLRWVSGDDALPVTGGRAARPSPPKAPARDDDVAARVMTGHS
ncbi:MAG: 4Fe-4S binding protein [Ectothiorhodospiraceae bacterium]|jgi:polyferredoxin|nr:4Fe-4S binding protein [Ectothiorhodospiraceae bacterium]